MREAELIRTIPFDGFLADEVYPADINGDGQIEYLFLQSPGIYQEDVFDDTRFSTPQEEKDIYCLTAVDAQGKMLWQFGSPWLESLQYGNHVADQMVWCGILSDRGRAEIAALRKDYLYILDGATGDVLRSRKLDADNYAIVRPIHSKSGARLLVKNTERHYGDHWYGDPAHIYDADLNGIAAIPQSIGSGHSPRMLDINGDGNDEVLIGYEAYNADGHHLWRLERQREEGYIPEDHHVDQIQAGPLGPNGEMRIVYAGSLNAMMGTQDGCLIWQRNFGHPQHVLLGHFCGGDKQARIAIFSCYSGKEQALFAKCSGRKLPEGRHISISWLNYNGEIVDLMFRDTAWPASSKRITPTHSGEGIMIYPQGCPDGSDAVITRDWGWPQAVDMSAEIPFIFPYPGSEVGKNEEDPVGPDGYGIRIADFDNDGRAEVLVHDRTTAWIFKPPFPTVDTPNKHANLKPVTGQGWYAF